MDPQMEPRTQAYRSLEASLNRDRRLRGLGHCLRLIRRVRPNGNEFVMEGRNEIQAIDSCLQQPPPQTVDVYYGSGQQGELRLARDPNGGRYVFSGPLIARITSGNNGEIKLQGYHGQANGVFVLTAE